MITGNTATPGSSWGHFQVLSLLQALHSRGSAVPGAARDGVGCNPCAIRVFSEGSALCFPPIQRCLHWDGAWGGHCCPDFLCLELLGCGFSSSVCLFVCFPFPWVFLRLTPPLQGPWLFWQGQLLGLAGRLLEALAENEHGICDWEQAPLQPHSECHRDLMEEREHGSTTIHSPDPDFLKKTLYDF